MDECGFCEGDGIEDGYCDCSFNVDLGCGCGESGPSGCDNVCGSTLENDECDVCGGDGSSCNMLGDLNGDDLINVLDVVMLVGIILSAGEFNPAGDLIEDGMLNVLDIVALVNIILGGG